MSTSLIKLGRLKPEIRLGQAISEFQADLSTLQKATFRSHQLSATPPGIRDVMQLTAEINRSGNFQGRCFGPRLTNVLQAVQQFAALGDIVLGGTQILLACGVWSLVRMTLLSIVKYSAYFERLSSMLMAVGRTAPRYQLMGAIYPKSEALRSSMLEYFIVIVQLCHHILRLSQKTLFGQWASTMTDTLTGYQSELDIWATSIKEEVNLLTAQHLALEFEENSWFRSHMIGRLESQSNAKRLKARKRALDACSVYDYERDWKQIRKLGNTTVLHSVVYTTWREDVAQQGSRTLVCTGKLGSGKSVILANIVDDLNLETKKEKPVAYFFCRHDTADSLTAQTVIGSLARQLLHQEADFDRASHIIGDRSSLDVRQIIALLKDMLPNTYRACIILDGLMHCNNNARQSILGALRELQDVVSLSLCISIRVDPSGSLKELEQLHNVEIFPIPGDNPDIDEFINAELQRCVETGMLAVNDPLLILEIQESLCRGAHGMFLWVALQIKSLCLYRTDADIREAISDLPTDLSDIYRLILERSRKVSADYQIKILELAMTTYRPLTTEEMREALCVTPGCVDWDPRRLLNDINGTLACCGGLLTIDEEDYSVRMIHHSVVAFLGKYHGAEQFDITRAKRKTGEILVTYLNYAVFSQQLSSFKIPRVRANSLTSSVVSTAARSLGLQSQRLSLQLLNMKKGTDRDIGYSLVQAMGHTKNAVLTPLAFYQYASSWWQEHVWEVNMNDLCIRALLQRMLQVQQDINKVDMRGQTLLSHVSQLGYVDMVDWLLLHGARDIALDHVGRTSLHYAAEAGNTSVVKSLLGSAWIQPNAEDQLGQTSLLLSIIGKRRDVIEWFVQCPQVSLDWKDANGRSYCMIAVAHNFPDVIPLLLAKNKGLCHEIDDEGNTLLHYAASHGCAKTVDFLLTLDLKQVHVNTKNSQGRTPLWVASANGHTAVVRSLCSHTGTQHDLADDNKETPFWIAAAHGHETAFRYLGSSEMVNLHHKNKWGYAALWMAARNGHVGILEYLVERQVVGVNDDNERGETAIWIAASRGHTNAVWALARAKDIEVNCVDANGRTPLWIAASLGHEGVTTALAMTQGVGLSFQCPHERTPLWAAAMNGHRPVLRSLALIQGVSVNNRDMNGATMLWVAAASGNETVAEALVSSHGTNLDLPDFSGVTPLWIAACNGHQPIVKLLAMTHRVVLNPRNGQGLTPFYAAASAGRESVVQFLAATEGVDVNSRAEGMATPLSVAVWNGHAGVVRHLVSDERVEINSPNEEDQSPLWIAAFKGHTQIVELLLQHPDIGLNQRSMSGTTPLATAAEQGHENVVRIIANAPGVQLHLADYEGETPYTRALDAGNDAVLGILISADLTHEST